MITGRADAVACLDLRQLPAPGPMLRALAASEALARGDCLDVLTPPLPVSLLRLLEARGFEASASMLRDGSAHVRVRGPEQSRPRSIVRCSGRGRDGCRDRAGAR